MTTEHPVHTHSCKTPKEWSDVKPWDPHEWECSSPYCNHLDRVCPKHGGKKPRDVAGDD